VGLLNAASDRVQRTNVACGPFVVLAFVMAAGAWAPTPQRLAIADALVLYDHGDYAKFLDAINSDGAVDKELFRSFQKTSEQWIAASAQTGRDRRVLVAASVALELAHLLRDQPTDRSARYLAWAGTIVRQRLTSAAGTAERQWYLTAIAGMEELDEPWALTSGARSGSSVLDPIARSLGDGGQLAIALKHFPDEPRFLLSKAEAAEWWALKDAEEIALVPSYVALARRQAGQTVLDQTALPPGSRDITETWNGFAKARWEEILREVGRAPQVEAEYRALDGVPDLQAEVELHLGYLGAVSSRWEDALSHLHFASEHSGEAYVRYLAVYLTGRIHQNMNNRSAALDAFEQAQSIVPNARSGASQLAVELLLTPDPSQQARAYALLQAANAGNGPDDPWRLFRHGDARLWPVYMAGLRATLR
jgi:hypothetical protein